VLNRSLIETALSVCIHHLHVLFLGSPPESHGILPELVSSATCSCIRSGSGCIGRLPSSSGSPTGIARLPFQGLIHSFILFRCPDSFTEAFRRVCCCACGRDGTEPLDDRQSPANASNLPDLSRNGCRPLARAGLAGKTTSDVVKSKGSDWYTLFRRSRNHRHR
jgi:hypothetical protein